MSDIKKIKDEYLNKLDKDQNIESINQIKTELFGKNGIVSNEFKKLGSVSQEERKKFASDLNFIKEELQNKITSKIKNHIKWLKTKDHLQRATNGFKSAISFMNSNDLSLIHI